MTTQNLTVANTASHDGYGATAIGLQDNATVMDSGLVSGSWQCWIWARFQVGSAIAQSSNVTVANFSLKATATDSSTTWAAEIVVEKVANSANVSGAFSNLSSRTFTTAKTTINNDATTTNTYKTWDISGAVQELINTYGIAAGDYILVAVRYATSTTSRRFYQRDNGAGDTPKLDLTYSVPPIHITSTFAATTSTSVPQLTRKLSHSINVVTATDDAELGIGDLVPIDTTIDAVVTTGDATLDTVTTIPVDMSIDITTTTGDAELGFKYLVDTLIEVVVDTVADVEVLRPVTSTFPVTTKTGGLEVQKLVLPKLRENGDEWDAAFSFGGSFVELNILADLDSISFTSGDFNTFAGLLQDALDAKYAAFVPPTVSIETVSDGTAFVMSWSTSSLTGAIAYSSHSPPSNFNGTYPTPYLFTYQDNGTARLDVTRRITSTFAASITTGSALATVRRKLTTALPIVTTTGTADLQTVRKLTSTFAASITTGAATLGIVRPITSTFAVVVTTTGNAIVTKKVTSTFAPSITTGDAVLGTMVYVSATFAATTTTGAAAIVIYCRLYSTWQTIITTAGNGWIVDRQTTWIEATTSTGSADLGNTRKLTTTIAVSVLPAGRMSVFRPVVSTFGIVTTTTGSSTIPKAIVSTFNVSVQTGTASIGHTRKLSSTFAVRTQTGTARLKNPIVSSWTPTISTTGNFKVHKKITTSIAVVVNPVALATVTRKVSTSIPAVVATTAYATKRIKLVSAWNPSITTTGTDTPRRKIASSLSIVTSTGSAVARTRRKLASTVAASIVTASALTTNRRKLTTAVQCSTIVQGTLSNRRKLSHAIGPILSTSGSCRVSRRVASSFGVVSSTAGTIRLYRKLAHLFAGQILTAGLIDVERNLSTRIDVYTSTNDKRPNFDDYIPSEVWNLPQRSTAWVLPYEDRGPLTLAPRSTVWVLPDFTFNEEGF